MIFLNITTTILNFFSSTYATYIFVLPEFSLINFILVVISLAVFWVIPDDLKNGKFQNKVFFFVYLVLLISIFSLSMLVMYIPTDFKFFIFFDHMLVDWVSIFFKIFLLITFSSILVIVRNYCLIYKLFDFEFIMLFIFAFLGSLIILSSLDFLTLYLSIELQALAFYALAAYKTNSVLSAESSIKYFILGAFASIFWLWGASLIYGATGLTNIYSLNYFLSASLVFNYFDSALFFGFIFFFIGLFFKLGVAPFHVWLPDVYQGAPLAVTAFFSSVPKISFLFIFFKFYYIAFGSIIIPRTNSFFQYDYFFNNILIDYFGFICLVFGFLSVFIGSIAGVGQHNIKRLFAYSSIVNIGFIILALGTGTFIGMQAAFVYLLIYIILTVNLFAVLLIVKSYTKTEVFQIAHFSEINSPLIGLILSLNLFSLAGIPPLVGFFSKFFIYFSLIDKGFYFLTILLSFLTIFSAFYYVRMISTFFFVPSLRGIIQGFLTLPSTRVDSYLTSKAEFDLIFLIVLTTISNILLFVHIDYLIDLSAKFVYLFF
jgi:NADH-quinone oxidoreductase subunit N